MYPQSGKGGHKKKGPSKQATKNKGGASKNMPKAPPKGFGAKQALGGQQPPSSAGAGFGKGDKSAGVPSEDVQRQVIQNQKGPRSCWAPDYASACIRNEDIESGRNHVNDDYSDFYFSGIIPHMRWVPTPLGSDQGRWELIHY